MSLIEAKDLKVKHLCGEYVNFPNAPEPEDIVYFMYEKTRKKKSRVFEHEDFVKIFGEEKEDIINESLYFLENSNYVEKIIEEVEPEDGVGESLTVYKYKLLDAAIA